LIASNLRPGDRKLKLEKNTAFAIFQKDFYKAIDDNDINYLQTSIKYSLQKGLKNNRNEDPILYAVLHDNPDAMQLFLNEEAEQTRAFEKRMEYLMFLSAIKNADGCCERLIKLGVDHNIKDRRGYTPLLIALKYDANEATELLLSYQTNFDPIISEAKKHSLMKVLAPLAMKIAIEEDNLNLAEKIFNAHRGVALQNYKNGYTIILHAVSKSPDISQLLLLPEHVYKKDDEGNTLLHYAVENNNEIALKKLIEMDADINAQNKQGQTPLHVALKNGRVKEMEIIMDANPDLSIKDNNGNLPIHAAASVSVFDLNSIKTILNKKETVNTQNDEGLTPLHIAVRYSTFFQIKLLLSNGADVSIKDKKSKTPYDYATNDKIKQLVMIKYFEKGWTNEISVGIGLPYEFWEEGLRKDIKYTRSYFFEPNANNGSFSVGAGLGLMGGYYSWPFYDMKSGAKIALNYSLKYSFRIGRNSYWFLKHEFNTGLFGPLIEEEYTSLDDDFSKSNWLRTLNITYFGYYIKLKNNNKISISSGYSLGFVKFRNSEYGNSTDLYFGGAVIYCGYIF
jgi:ankyrin repeat protein